MEVSSSIAKTLKRLSIPRSTSSIGSFTASNGTAADTEQNTDGVTPPPTSHSSTHHRHPPLSYAQHLRPTQQHYSQQNLTEQSEQKYNLPTRPASGDISSFMIRSTPSDFQSSTNEYIPKKSKLDIFGKKSTIPRGVSADQIRDSTVTDNKTMKTNGHQRSSIKSMLIKKFHPPATSASGETPRIEIKPKKTSIFRNFLKRSHSNNTDLSTITKPNNNHHPQSPLRSLDESDLTKIIRLNTSSNALKTISEEDNNIPINHQQNQLKAVHNETNGNTNRVDSGTISPPKIQTIGPSLSVSSSSSLSGISSTSNKHQNGNTQSQQRDDSVKPSKSSLSVISNAGPSLSVHANDSSIKKSYLTNSISLHEDVTTSMNGYNLSSSNTTNSKEHTAIHQTMSLTTGSENTNMSKVRMRDHSAKKKKGLRDLKSRISLPPELKNSTNDNNNNQLSESNFSKLKLPQRSSYYQTTSVSSQALNSALNRSNISLSSQINSPSNGQISRNEQRLSMLCLGFGKIESYTKLEKLGEGTYATVYKGTSSFFNGYIALKEIRLEQEEGAPCTALREVSLLKSLKHNNIVSLYDIIFNQTTLTLVFEYVDKDLKQYMDDCGTTLSMKNVRLFLYQLLRGLEFCHSRKILHRDLKPQNLLINERGELKLADFGLARIKSFPTKTYSHEVVTLWYRPPDVLLGSTEYSTPIDIWAVGCIFFEMACGRPLFPGTKVDEELYLIFKYLGTPSEQTLPGVTSNPDFQALKLSYYYGEPLDHLAPRFDQNGIDLLEKFLRYNPLSRISAHDAMLHTYFSCYPPEIQTLGPLQSILDLNDISLARDHSSKLLGSSLMKTAIAKRSSVHL